MRIASPSGSGAIASIRPIFSASAAFTRLPVMSISSVAASPTSRGKRCVPPQPVIMPRPAPGCEKRAFGDAMRLSHANARSKAPPKQNPLTAATVVCGRDVMFDISVCPRRAYSAALSPLTSAISRRSAPDAKTSATPVNISRSNAWSPATSSTIVCKRKSTEIDSGLRVAGRLKQTMSVASLCSVTMASGILVSNNAAG